MGVAMCKQCSGHGSTEVLDKNRALPHGTFSQQQVVGFHVARKWILTIGASGEAKWAHETYTDSPGDDFDDNFMDFSGSAEWCDDGTATLQITMLVDGVNKQFKAKVSEDTIEVEEEYTPSGGRHHYSNGTLHLTKRE